MKKLFWRLFFLTLIVTSCSTFQKSKKVNLAPFAENAVSIVSEIEYGLSTARAIHVREFIDGPAVENYKETWEKLGNFLRGIVAYSVKIVTISQSDMEDNEKANLLADYVEVLAENVFRRPELGFEMTTEEFEAAINNIRKAEIYFEAMNGAQPIVDEVARVARIVIEELETAQENARIEVANKIVSEHAPILSFRDDIKRAQSRTLKTMTLFSRFKFGDTSALDTIIILDPQLKDYYKSAADFNLEVQDKFEERMLFRLETITKIQEQIFPELEQYQKEMRELDDLIAIADRGIRQSKGAIGVWRQSHQTMALGITEPAAIDLFGIAKAALKKVAPIE